MPGPTLTSESPDTVRTAQPFARHRSRVDRALSMFTEVRAGEGVTALLMLVTIFLLLVCYSVIKTVREPLILLGGGAEVRSYAAAGQALLLAAFVPAYSRFASRVDRSKLLVGVTLFFVACIELFAGGVAARLPYVGVAFFIWVGIFNMSLVAQFWSFANDIYTKPAGDRLFPVIGLGMTAGAPLGSFVSARLFRLGFTPQTILQLAAALLCATAALYLAIGRREARQHTSEPLPASGGFQLVLGSPYLRLIAALIVLLNVVNTTGEYLISRLLTNHVAALAHANAAFDKQAFIGAYVADYQFWVNIGALLLQSFVTARLVRRRGLAGVLLLLPLIAFGGYAVVAAGAGFAVTRWIKTAENATDYSIMNTARQLLWLPATREEKYKAKQAIDTFFVRIGDVLSAGVVYLGTGILQLTVQQFAAANVAVAAAWLGVAALLLKPRHVRVPMGAALRPAAGALATAVLIAIATPAHAQTTREEQLAAERAGKASALHPYEPDQLERSLALAESMFMSTRSFYPFIGSAFDGGGLAVGPGYRARVGDAAMFDAHAAISVRQFKAVDARLTVPDLAPRVSMELHASWLDAPRVAFFGVGNDSPSVRANRAVRTDTFGATARIQATRVAALGAGIESIGAEMAGVGNPRYLRTELTAEIDSRNSPGYTRRGSLYRIEWSDYRQINGNGHSFRRLDGEVDQFIPVLRENWVIALRALASTTDSAAGNAVPYFFMPDLGGSHTLRGYPSWRFRDRNRMLLTGEYRWTAGSFVDMALFVDAGKVAPRFADLNFQDLTTAYGVGVSLHTPGRTVARIELARTRDGNALSLSFSPSF